MNCGECCHWKSDVKYMGGKYVSDMPVCEIWNKVTYADYSCDCFLDVE